MFPGRELPGNPPSCEMERYFYAERTNEASSSQLNHPSSDDGESSGVVTATATTTAIFNSAWHSSDRERQFP